MIKFKQEQHVYTRYLVELTPELIKHLQKETKKKVEITDNAEGIISDKLCAFALEGITEKDIEENIVYSLVDKIKNSSVDSVRIMAIDNVGIVVPDGNYAPYNLYVLRSNI